MSSEEPKLIIDEDWKTQVQREKEELKHKLAEEESAAAENTPADSSPLESSTTAADLASQPTAPEPTAPEFTEDDTESSGPLPPASISVLITTLATQAMAAMGLMPDAQGAPLPVKLDFARHFIDMLSTLEEKTRGNLSEDEKSLISDALHQLRMAFVAVSKQK